MQLLDDRTPLLNTQSITLHVTREQFETLCHDNPELRLELTHQGELIIMPPASLDSSGKNLDLATDVAIWNRQTKLGKVYDSSGGFTLPNGALKSADVMWLQQSKVDALPPNATFPEVVPDFVIKLRSSKSDSLSKLQEKMIEYRDNGVRLGWLINPQQQKVEIYRINREVEIMESPSTLSGEDVLVGFSLSSKINMAYSNFTLSKVKSDFGLVTDETQDLFAEITPILPIDKIIAILSGNIT
jgi:Uma2 family endonuclease